MRGKKIVVLSIIFLLLVQTVALIRVPVHAEERTVTLVGNLQDELGGSEEWNPADPKTVMTRHEDGTYRLTGALPAGTYEYKIAINGSWDENYGAGGEPNGPNYQLTLEREMTVTFIYNDTTHLVTVPIPLSKEQQPRIVGDIQPDIGAGSEWSPAESTAFLEDNDHDNIYTYTATVPKGKHEFKIVLGNSWEAPAYPSENFVLNVWKETEITFFYNHESKAVYTDYDPGVPDGQIQINELYHDTWDELYRSPFGAVKAGQKVKLRLQSKKGDLSRAQVMLRNLNTGKSMNVEMENTGWTELNGKQAEFWEATVQPAEKGVYGYKFIVRDGNAVKEYGEDAKQGHTGSAVDNQAALFQLTVYDPGYQTPDWMKEAVVYQIFPDRFSNGNKQNDTAKKFARGSEPVEHRKWDQLPDNPRLKESEGYDGDGIWSNDFFGGDITGIQQKLDYLQSLGVNTLYLNPIASAASNHKYDATDYKTLDPMFGSPEEFQAFVRELKKRNMRLILDGVFNHTGDDSVYFDRYGKYKTVGAYEYWSRIYDLVNRGINEAEAKKQVEKQLIAEGQEFSPYGFHNWFNIENKKENGVYKYQAWWGFDSLPEIKSVPGSSTGRDSELNNRKFANYIFYDDDSVAKTWLDRGASGWRLDVANEVDPDFWREFRKELKKDPKKEPLILGEIWDDASQYFLGDLFDSVMNYRFRNAILDYLKNGNAERAAEELRAVQEDYPPEAFYALMNLLGSHDTPRAAFILGNGTDSYERAEHDQKYNHQLGLQRLKLASIIQMGYPGAPTIYYGDEAGLTGSKDPDNRRTYPWGKENRDLIRHYQKIGNIRNEYKQLFAYGKLIPLYAKEDVLVYARHNGKQIAIVAVNRGNRTKTVQLDVKELVRNHVLLTDQLDKSYKATTADGKLSLTLLPMSGRMMVSGKGQNIRLPKAVSNLTAFEGDHSVTLKWNGNAKSYHIYQTTVSGALYRKVAVTNQTNITIHGLNNGRKYYFAVTAVDKEQNESLKTATREAVIPHVKLSPENTNIQNITQLEEATLDLSKQQVVSGEIFIAGATEKSQAEGLIAKLEVKEPETEEWISHPAVYTGQNNEFNRFSAQFLPVTPGTYEYRYAFSADLGRTWLRSESKSVTIGKAEDTSPPADGVTLKQPTRESGQVNLTWTVQNSKDPYMIAVIRNGKTIAQLFDTNQTTYKDTDVTNGTLYRYQVKIFDQYGNAVTSNTVSVTPDLVTVKVTFKVHVPDYTPQDVNITIPSSKNGWNTGAWEMTRAGAVTNDYEYTIEALEGEVITYKYVKNASWDQEGLADHTPNNPSDDDVSYYGYGAPGTDLQIVVNNQGDNRMIVQDNILRWIDQPVVITSHTDGQTVTSDTLTLKGTAIKEGVLTINGESVPIREDMSFSHTVPLKSGPNTFNIHIEPSEENKTAIFRNDAGAIAKNTKDLTFTIYKN
ncbi:alpha amylase N-terminal ig-like domain-containing protein [Lihuaxuella thermophila]|uniref:alpha amylase N-terminal ig-like domain-containing protein n=1 Tax=Lihuaxuella thermophila TaxID=1173111 RepID=UPI001FCDCBBC|nr:alpha amylase N-terminal ig-like domain-containing protein [Lihuaxuella thermophila]